MISVTLGNLIPSTRFAARYASRSRRRQSKPQARQYQSGKISRSFDNSKDFESEFGRKPGDSSAAIELPPYSVTFDTSTCQTCSRQSAKFSLERLLCLDRTMEAIARELHASDIRHLGQAFGGIRPSLYTHRGTYPSNGSTSLGAPNHIPQHEKAVLQVKEHLVHTERIGLLYDATCRNSKKTRCWACDIQICTSCTIQSKATAANIQHHIDNCTPYCHKCYFHEICRKQRSFRRQERCSHSTRLYISQVTRSLCKQCSSLTPEDVGRRREAREKKELALLASQAMRCANCSLSLPSRGPGWWVCNWCRLECTDACHH